MAIIKYYRYYVEVIAKAISYISDSVVAGKKLSLVFVALLSLCTSVQAEANFTLWVRRRSTIDLYSLNSIATVENCDPKTSYLINEKQCALDEEFFYGTYVKLNPIIILIFHRMQHCNSYLLDAQHFLYLLLLLTIDIHQSPTQMINSTSM